MELAKHGYLVIGMAHQDKSCIYTVTADGKDLYHGPKLELEQP